MMNWRCSLMALAFACLAVEGCVNLGPKPNPSRFFTLTPIAEAESAPNHSDGAVRRFIGIGPVKLPAYLDREELVTRVSQNRLAVSENDRWIEALEENFSRVLARNLSALIPDEKIIRYPWAVGQKPAYRVEIEVFRFEPNSAEDVQLSARWLLIDASGKKPVMIKESRIAGQSRGRSTEAAVAALSEALGNFSREIAGTIRTLTDSAKP